MKRTIPFVLIASFILLLAGCSKNQVQTMVPEVELIANEDQQYPRLKTTDEDEISRIINAEIEAQFQRLNDGGSDTSVRTFTSSTDTTISILLKAEYNTAYGTDGEVWGICYDYSNKMIVPCGAYLSGLGYSYADICKKVEAMLYEESTYEYIGIPYLYFDSSSNPVLVVVALEHPAGADPWERIYYYSLNNNSFVDSLG